MSLPGGWRGSPAAARVRDVMVTVAQTVIARERPEYKYGIVESLDEEAGTCNILYPGAEASVPVKCYLVSADVGETVRVAGLRGDRYVEAKITGDPDGGGVDLGETSSTAYRGDRGKEAYDHSLEIGNAHDLQAEDIAAGIFNIARIPTGTTVTTVRLGNDPAFSDERVPTANSVTSAKIADGAIEQSKIANLHSTALSRSFIRC